MTASPIIPSHPLDHPGSIKILLGQAASDILAAHGEHFLAVVSHPDSTSPPHAAGRMILTCLPLRKDALNAAHSVALGRCRAVRVKATTPTAACHPSPIAPDPPQGNVAPCSGAGGGFKSLEPHDPTPLPARNFHAHQKTNFGQQPNLTTNKLKSI